MLVGNGKGARTSPKEGSESQTEAGVPRTMTISGKCRTQFSCSTENSPKGTSSASRDLLKTPDRFLFQATPQTLQPVEALTIRCSDIFHIGDTYVSERQK